MAEQRLLFERSTQEKFDIWVHTPYGGEVMNKFIRCSLDMKKAGFDHYSQWTIAGRVRFHYDLKFGNRDMDGFKINNNWIAYMARFAMERCKELKGFFQLRELKTKGF